MYSVRQLKDGLLTPQAGLRELNRLYWTRRGKRSHNPDGVDVFEEDWDNLIILDGCRYDYFAEVLPDFDVPGELDSRRSKGAATMEFLRGNMDGRDLSDTVYVTASTKLYQEDVFRETVDVDLHDSIDVWSNSIDYGEDGVHPSAVTRRSREAAETYPNKRLLVHYVQPHAPYIGERGREAFPDYRPNPLAERFLGKIDTDTEDLVALYEENLRLVMGELESLLPDLPGKTVITADHGMLLGERERPIPIRSFGHPPGIYVDEMVTVPWHVVENGPRKDVVAEAPQSSYADKRDDDLDDRAREHLQQMGYL